MINSGGLPVCVVLLLACLILTRPYYSMASLINVMELANFDCERIAKRLIEEEEANDFLGMTSLLEAATLGVLSAVKDPLAAGTDSNICDGRDELFLLGTASLMGHLEVVRVLLVHGADVNDASPRGYTALHHAALFGRAGLLADVIDLLLSDRARIDAPTATEFMPLLVVSYRQDAGFSSSAERRRTRWAASASLPSIWRPKGFYTI